VKAPKLGWTHLPTTRFFGERGRFRPLGTQTGPETVFEASSVTDAEEAKETKAARLWGGPTAKGHLLMDPSLFNHLYINNRDT